MDNCASLTNGNVPLFEKRIELLLSCVDIASANSMNNASVTFVTQMRFKSLNGSFIEINCEIELYNIYKSEFRFRIAVQKTSKHHNFFPSPIIQAYSNVQVQF
ncbi:hypothetical protein T01_710 [Trichinella spiralis]|uniref:Uncharacterized protein n=1 Tax=Trichinella spiralis TaxID=6334 RepID=A0A0V1BJ26_TRISP|nr:hypothetical protein T01_710 [Trichinella spiralis]